MKALRLFIKYFLNQQPAKGPVKQNDFDMYLESVDYLEYIAILKAFPVSSKIIETIIFEAKPYEILQLDINPGSKKRLLIFAGIHGNEFAAALSVIDIMNDIQQNPDVYESCHIQIITPLNPVGFAHQSRYNEVGRDINRDFKDFSTIGGQLQKRVLEVLKPDFLISLHEGPQEGFFVVAERGVPKSLQSNLILALKNENIQLATKSFLRIGIAEGYWRKNALFYTLQKLLGIYTLGRHSYKCQIPQLTTETPWSSRDVAARRRPHTVTVRSVVQSL